MEQYPIPQFIEEEGKIVFFLTYRQFFLLVGGGAACVLLYFVPMPFFLFVICAGLIILLTAAIAFLKINNASVVTVFLNYLGFTIGAKTYTWKKKEAAYPIKVRVEPQTTGPKETPALSMQAGKLNEIKKIVETKKLEPDQK